MLNTTVFLTIATILGLVAGFAREWLIIDAWGASARSDAFMVASFVPEAFRMTLASGLISAAALPLFSKLDIASKANWFRNQLVHFLLLGIVLALLLMLLSPVFTFLVGPGLSDAQHSDAVETLKLLAWVLPAVLLHALLSLPHNFKQQFIRTGLGSLFFNFPAVIYLAVQGKESNEQGLALSFITGSIVMLVILIPGLPKPTQKLGGTQYWQSLKADIIGVHRLLFPLLLSSGASQGLALLERMVASFLGEGAVTIVNLARKLINLPLVALMSLNQVLLSKMSVEDQTNRIAIFRQGMKVVLVITLPASVGIISASSGIIDFLLPAGLTETMLPLLFALMAITIVFGSWNALLARYFYAEKDTKTPLKYEIIGGLVNAILLVALSYFVGIVGIALATICGVLVTGYLLLKKTPKGMLDMGALYAVSTLVLLISMVFLYPLNTHFSSGLLVLVGTVSGLLCFVSLLVWLKPWRVA